MKTVATFLFTGIILGCSSTSTLFYKDGREAKIIDCEGSTWMGCLKQASIYCKQAGYETLEKTGYRDSGIFANTDKKEMIIICKESPKIPTDVSSDTNPESKK